MPILTLLPLIFSAVGAAANGYKFLQEVEAAHPGSKLTQEHLAHLAQIDAPAHAAAVQAQAQYFGGKPGEMDLIYGEP